jgi:hypothetical protein
MWSIAEECEHVISTRNFKPKRGCELAGDFSVIDMKRHKPYLHKATATAQYEAEYGYRNDYHNPRNSKKPQRRDFYKERKENDIHEQLHDLSKMEFVLDVKEKKGYKLVQNTVKHPIGTKLSGRELDYGQKITSNFGKDLHYEPMLPFDWDTFFPYWNELFPDSDDEFDDCEEYNYFDQMACVDSDDEYHTDREGENDDIPYCDRFPSWG